MTCRCTAFPPLRLRAGGAAPTTTEKYERYESTPAEVTLGDTDTVVITFAGQPDSIVLEARTQGALFTLTDELGRETHAIAVQAGATQETHISRRRVLGRNLVAGMNAAAFVVGKWAERGERA
ncbi:MAG: hypothetical protein ACREM3_29485 [Candidatus Rokuibacteriota bacterium]